MIKTLLKKITLPSVLLVLILLVAITNRVYGLDRLSLFSDELWVVMESAKGSLMDMFAAVRYRDNHPPGQYLFTRYWQILFGDSDYAVRFPYAFTGVLVVFSTYIVARKNYSVAAGLIAAALVSSSWQAIYYSQEARANMMVALTALWALHSFYQVAFINLNSKKYKIIFWISSTLCCYLHYAGMVYAASLLVIFCCFLSLRREDMLIRAKAGLKLFFPVFLLYTPWLSSLFYHMTHKPVGAWWQVPPWDSLYANFKWMFGYSSNILYIYNTVFLLLIILLLLKLIHSKKINTTLAKKLGMASQEFTNLLSFSSLLLLAIVIPVMIFFIKSQISMPIYDYRHFIYTIPLMAIATGGLITLFLTNFRKNIADALLAVMVVAIIVNQNYSNIVEKLYLSHHFKPEYRQLVEVMTLNQARDPDPSFFIIINSDYFNHYLRRALDGRASDYLLSGTHQLNALDELVKNKNPDSIYFLEIPINDGHGMISNLDARLAENYHVICRVHYVYGQIIKYNKGKQFNGNWDQIPDCNPI